MSQVVQVDRLAGGKPLILPTKNSWEDWMTCNAAALHLERNTENDKIIKKLLSTDELGPELDAGVIAIHYRAVPIEKGDLLWFQSHVGLAVFNTDYQLLKRYDHPVLSPCEDPEGDDHISLEDPRITPMGGEYYMVYCGFTMPTWKDKRIKVCMAKSRDLINWEKMGPVKGQINLAANKDGVLFPEKINGNYVLLHRPMVGNLSDYSMELAVCSSLDGEWENLGKVMQAVPDDQCEDSWIGAGPVPIKIEKNRYLVIYHVGKRYKNGDRDYFIDAAIMNFDIQRGSDCSSLVEKRLEHIMVPENKFETHAPDDDKNMLNVLFPCGSYVLDEDIHIIYGGANTYVLAGKINKRRLVESIENHGFENPAIRSVLADDLDQSVVL